MQEIGDFLEKLGMPEYGERFAENDIDASVLPHLTDQSLKELGVSLGHRLKILAAIKELSGLTPAAPGPAVAPAEPKPQDTAERRQVTVMFSDLVGSTALSARMDPEDLREVISSYLKCVAQTVQRFGGFVAKYMGDGVLVYFGYPQAHEDDAERAVRAGLELASVKASAPLQARIGIATGLVIVGDLIGSGEAQERGIVGETPNLAGRLAVGHTGRGCTSERLPDRRRWPYGRQVRRSNVRWRNHRLRCLGQVVRARVALSQSRTTLRKFAPGLTVFLARCKNGV